MRTSDFEGEHEKQKTCYSLSLTDAIILWVKSIKFGIVIKMKCYQPLITKLSSYSIERTINHLAFAPFFKLLRFFSSRFFLFYFFTLF